jgi:hypothetical protein
VKITNHGEVRTSGGRGARAEADDKDKDVPYFEQFFAAVARKGMHASVGCPIPSRKPESDCHTQSILDSRNRTTRSDHSDVRRKYSNRPLGCRTMSIMMNGK